MNLHLLSSPIFERHTAFNMVSLRIKVLDSVFPSWRCKLIGIGSDHGLGHASTPTTASRDCEAVYAFVKFPARRLTWTPRCRRSLVRIGFQRPRFKHIRRRRSCELVEPLALFSASFVDDG